jgi:hypothetical protein
MRVRDIGDIKRKSQLAKLENCPQGVCAVLCGNAKILLCLPKERQYPNIQRVKIKGKR